MIRDTLALAIAVTFSLAVGVTRGQEEHPPGGHGMPPHSAAEHGLHVEHGVEEMGMEEDLPPEIQQNFLMWVISSLGWRYVLLLPASTLMSFALTALLVVVGKGKTTGAALGFIVAIPFLIGLFGMFDGLMCSFMVIAASTAMPKPSILAEGISMSIVTPLIGMLLMVPSYLLATVGLAFRAMKNDPKP